MKLAGKLDALRAEAFGRCQQVYNKARQEEEAISSSVLSRV